MKNKMKFKRDEYVVVYMRESKKLKNTVQISVPTEYLDDERLAQACKDAVESYQHRLMKILEQGHH